MAADHELRLMFKISNNLPEVFRKSPDELARCVRRRGGGALRDWGDLTHAPASSSQEMVAFLLRAELGESYTGQECRIHRSKQPRWGWRKDVLHTSRKIRGRDPLTWKWFTGEDRQIHQNLLQHPVPLQSSVRPAPTPQAPCTAANPLKFMCQESRCSR